MPNLVEILRETSRNIQRILESIEQGGGGPVSLTSADLSELLRELQSAGNHLVASCGGGSENHLDQQLAEYRNHLEKLRDALANLQMRLIVERAALDREQGHLQAATGWARANEDSR